MSETLATVYKIQDGLYRARILYMGTTFPVDYYRQFPTESDLVANLLFWMGLDTSHIVTPTVFQWELDHINLFGCRRSQEQPDFFVLPEDERLTDEKILEIIKESNNLLKQVSQRIDESTQEYNALLSSGDVEN